MKINLIGKCSIFLKLVAKNSAKKTFKAMGQPDNLEVSIMFVSSDEIKKLNAERRNIDKVTDVLSFPATTIKAGEIVSNKELAESSFDGVNVYLGDCALCIEVAKRQSKEFGNSLNFEIKKLITHSMLHLLGYDHIKDEDYALMHKYENEILGETND